MYTYCAWKPYNLTEESYNMILIYIDVFMSFVIHKYIHSDLGKYVSKIDFDELLALKM